MDHPIDWWESAETASLCCIHEDCCSWLSDLMLAVPWQGTLLQTRLATRTEFYKSYSTQDRHYVRITRTVAINDQSEASEKRVQ